MVHLQVSLPLRRIGYTLLTLLILAVLIRGGRLAQVAWDSRYDGPREPYLQMVSPSGITVRWQSGTREIGVVRYGLEPDRLDRVRREDEPRISHEVRLTDLSPATRFYYSVGTEDAVFREGSDYWFLTAPSPGSAASTRFWVQGDPGWWNEGSRAVRESMLRWVEANPRPGRPFIDLWLTTGDNAYTSGRAREYQAALFEPYADLLRNIPYIPVYGNHDARRWAFFRIFSFPTAGECGGVASGSPRYFSFDYANIHFVVLDSESSDRGVDGSMMRWLRRDLELNRQPWLIALFHHPPYTRGSHDSDRRRDSRGRMFDMRERFLPVLEAADVDLVLSGHTHMYERSFLLSGHYGHSGSLQPEMIRDRSLGADPLYRKTAASVSHGGTVYAVVGSTSIVDEGPLDHPVMAVALRELGSLVVDVEGPKLIARFINDRGRESDLFGILKSPETPAKQVFLPDR